MKEKTQIVYYCEYCKKHWLRKHFVERHEKYCGKNPNNLHKCFQDCKHLIENSKSIKIYDNGLEEQEFHFESFKNFHCEKLNKDLYSYKAEKCNHSCINGAERMPLECEFYSCKLTKMNMGYDEELYF